MWVGVRKRFSVFDSNLKPSDAQRDDAQTKQLGIRRSLHRSYYDTEPDPPKGFLVGSWGKGTQTAPPNDIDIFFTLPNEVYHRINNRSGNKQSALLQEIKACLQPSYPQTDMRGDGQVVQVAFNSILVEIVPVFKTTNQYEYIMPDANDGGSWKSVFPEFDTATIGTSDIRSNGNTRSLIRMIKTWKRFCNVPLKSFVLERLVYEFLEHYGYYNQDYYWFDWIVRDFFRYLVGQADTSIWLPSASKYIPIGDDWLAKAQKAVELSLEACDLEHDDYVYLAGEKWQMIFGSRITAG